jgi:hypothetical protein
MQWKHIKEGFDILDKYISDEDRSPLQEAHDIIYIGPDSVNDVSDADRERLDELGFMEDEEFDCFSFFT